MEIPQDILKTLRDNGQEHLVRFWDGLSDLERQQLLRQIREIDFPLVNRLINLRSAPHAQGESAAHKAERAQPPDQLVRLSRTQADLARESQAAAAGQQLLRDGKIGAILVAGGQGTRLGFDDPKGMFPIGPVTNRTLFQFLCEQLLARSRRAGRPIPYFIMTSEATHEPTVAFFERQNYFGLNKDEVFFFQQTSLPVVEDVSHRIHLETRGRIATSPDGHGGMLRALERTGMLEVMRQRRIEHVYYHQVDNPTAIVCDPAFLGHHLLSDSDLSTKVVAKVSPDEKMGVLASLDGQTQIIEYSDLPIEQARRKQPDGTLVFWAGNTAIHAFKRSFLESLLQDDLSLPFHVAHKKVACVNPWGEVWEPDQPNASKFEQFIFDALPHARVGLVVEGDRAREFNPVKNAEGADSPATCRAALVNLAREWIQSAGGRVASGVSVEISPLYALDATDLKAKLKPGRTFTTPTVLE